MQDTYPVQLRNLELPVREFDGLLKTLSSIRAELVDQTGTFSRWRIIGCDVSDEADQLLGYVHAHEILGKLNLTFYHAYHDVKIGELVDSEVLDEWEAYQREIEERWFVVPLYYETIRIISDALREYGVLEQTTPMPCEDSAGEISPKRRPGRPPLEGEELIYRLAKAQEGEAIKAKDPSMTWKEIARVIQWRYGFGKRGIKFLENARRRLRGADPDLLNIVAEERKKRKTT